jgi:hypothetical protein
MRPAIMSSMQRSMKMRATVASVLISASTKRVFCISISAWPKALRSRVCSTVSLQRALDRGHAGHAEDGALVRQLGHQLGEALPFLPPSTFVQRHAGVVEEQLAGVLALLPDLLEDAADAEARSSRVSSSISEMPLAPAPGRSSPPPRSGRPGSRSR